MHLQRGLKYLSRKLRFLQWDCYPMKRLPSEFNTEFIVTLYMQHSKLEKLWEGIRPLGNLMGLGFFGSGNLKKLPDLSTAINLKELDLSYCSSLVTLPSTIGNATSLVTLRLEFCNKLVELPSTIGNHHKLQRLGLQGCSKLEVLPTNINLESLEELNLSYCYLLKHFSGISTNIKILKLSGTAIEEVTSSLMPRLDKLYISNLEYLKEFPIAFASIRYLWLSGEETRETPPWIKKFTCLRQLTLDRCSKLVSLHIPGSLESIYAEGCECLETIDWPSNNSKFSILNFINCFKFNKEARDFIIQTWVREYAILPGGEVPLYFPDRAIGDSVTVKLNARPSFPASFRYKVCILLTYKGEGEDNYRIDMKLSTRIVDKQSGLSFTFRPRYVNLNSVVKGHLCIFDVEAEVKVTSRELFFEFKVDSEKWEVGECGVQLQLMQHDVSDQESKALM